MKSLILLGMAVTALGLGAIGCGSNDNGGGGSGGSGSGSGGSGGSGGTGGTKATGGSTSSGGTSGNASGGAGGSNSSTGGNTGGSTSTEATCGTTDGTYQENTTFASATDPYKINQWGTWGNSTLPALTQTTTGPTGLDCGAGCAALTIDFSSGTAQYAAGSMVEYFGSASDSVTNLLNETITAKIAVTVAQASGATTAVPISIRLFGQDSTTSTSGVDNLWIDELDSASALDAATGWHTVTFKVVDTKVPSWAPARTVCASALHSIGFTIQNNSAITADNGAVVTLYVQSVAVSP